MEFKERIKYVRGKLLLSQEELGRRIGVSFATINRWEAGRSDPKFLKLKAFEAFCEENNIKFD